MIYNALKNSQFSMEHSQIGKLVNFNIFCLYNLLMIKYPQDMIRSD